MKPRHWHHKADEPDLRTHADKHREIEEDVERFLRAGGQIEILETGASGYVPKSRSIILGQARAKHARAYIPKRPTMEKPR